MSVNVMNDDERHLSEYKKYANELLEKLKTETDKQHKYWFESRSLDLGESSANRVPSGGDWLRLYFPVNKPFAKGKYGRMPIP